MNDGFRNGGPLEMADLSEWRPFGMADWNRLLFVSYLYAISNEFLGCCSILSISELVFTLIVIVSVMPLHQSNFYYTKSLLVNVFYMFYIVLYYMFYCVRVGDRRSSGMRKDKGKAKYVTLNDLKWPLLR